VFVDEKLFFFQQGVHFYKTSQSKIGNAIEFLHRKNWIRNFFSSPHNTIT